MSAQDNFAVVQSPKHFQDLLSADLERVSVINFWAPWVEPCKLMNEVVEGLSKTYPKILFLQVAKTLTSSTCYGTEFTFLG